MVTMVVSTDHSCIMSTADSVRNFWCQASAGHRRTLTQGTEWNITPWLTDTLFWNNGHPGTVILKEMIGQI